MSEQHIKLSQQALKTCGFYAGKIDGDWGKMSHTALTKSLTNDGYTPPKTNKTIVITAGHGGRDSGAVNGNITESHIATEMRNMITYYLQKAGVQVVNDGDGHENLPLTDAVKLIRKGDIAVELHTNAAYSLVANGVEALARPDDKAISQKLCTAVANVLGIPLRGDNGWKSESSGQHSRLAYVSNGGIILELFFISNPNELRKYQERKWTLARSIADVLMQHV